MHEIIPSGVLITLKLVRGVIKVHYHGSSLPPNTMIIYVKRYCNRVASDEEAVVFWNHLTLARIGCFRWKWLKIASTSSFTWFLVKHGIELYFWSGALVFRLSSWALTFLYDLDIINTAFSRQNIDHILLVVFTILWRYPC